jgi:hypothetical protein
MRSGQFTMILEDLQDEPIEISWQTPDDSPVWDHAHEQVRLHQEESGLQAPTLLLAALAPSAVHADVSAKMVGEDDVRFGNSFRLLCQVMSQQTGADHIVIFLDQNRMVTNILSRKYAPPAETREAR